MPKFKKTSFRGIIFLLLIIALPLFVWAVLTQRFELRKKATTGEPSVCAPLGNNIYVTPQGSSGTCHDIQTAINAVSGSQFTINIAPGSYTVPESGNPFSLSISNKSYLTITGNATAGTGAVQLIFNGNHGGIVIENSSNVSVQWMTINGNTSNGLVSSRGSSNTSLGYLVLADQGAHTVDFNSGSTGSLFNSDVTSIADAVDVNNMQGINISNNVIHNARQGVVINNSNGSVLANLFKNNSGPSLDFNMTNNLHVEHNTITANNVPSDRAFANVTITNSVAPNTAYTFTKNIIANNQGIGIFYNDSNAVNTYDHNDVFGNSAGNYAGISAFTGANGNISADPLFGTEYCLNSGSPALYGNVQNNEYMGYRPQCGPVPTVSIAPNVCTNQVNGTSCVNSVCPSCYYSTPRCLIPCTLVNGTCQNQVCTPNPVATITPITTITPTQSPCQGQANGTVCNAGVCPQCPPGGPCPGAPCSFVPGSCQNGSCIPLPTVTIAPPGQYLLQMFPSGNLPPVNIGFDTIAYVTLSQNGFTVPNQQDLVYTWSIDDPTIATITPFAQCTGGVTAPCPLDHVTIHALKPTPFTHVRVNVARSSNPGIWLASATFNLTVTGGPEDFQFKIRFGGVTDGSADGATATIRFVNIANNIDLITPPVIFRHTGSGVYTATITVDSSNLPPGPGYNVFVKGEKHVAIKFCKVTGQTGPCQPISSLSLPAVSGAAYQFDFTGMSLPPGDLQPQDGVVDTNDFAKIQALLSKPCSALTNEDKFAGDLDYSGCITAKDVGLFRQTLQTRYDEN